MSDRQPERADILILQERLEERQLLAEILGERGYQVRQATDERGALAAVAEELPDLILLDLEASPWHGDELYRKLQEKEATRDIPLIFCGDSGEVEVLARAFAIGGADYLRKPYRPAEIVARIERQLYLSYRYKQLQGQKAQLQARLQLCYSAVRHTSPTSADANLFWQAVSATDSGIVLIDAAGPDYLIRYVNPGFERMTGYGAKDAIGKPYRFLGDIPGELLTGKASCHIFQHCRRDGSLFWDEVSLCPISNNRGEVTYWMAIHLDVSGRNLTYASERQRQEAVLRQMNRELERKNRELDRANRQLERLANSDGLTGLANRRYFDERLMEEWGRMMREESPLSLILADIDYFKAYNDTYYHLAGDDCLKTVAQAIAQTLRRAGDLVARYGGEEFAAILPNTPGEGAWKVAQTILDNVRQLKISHEASPIQDYVTMSLGVVTIVPNRDLDADFLLRTADSALYEAKARGRDRAISRVL